MQILNIRGYLRNPDNLPMLSYYNCSFKCAATGVCIFNELKFLFKLLISGIVFLGAQSAMMP
jgi:hypothetical protein